MPTEDERNFFCTLWEGEWNRTRTLSKIQICFCSLKRFTYGYLFSCDWDITWHSVKTKNFLIRNVASSSNMKIQNIREEHIDNCNSAAHICSNMHICVVYINTLMDAVNTKRTIQHWERVSLRYIILICADRTIRFSFLSSAYYSCVFFVCVCVYSVFEIIVVSNRA